MKLFINVNFASSLQEELTLRKLKDPDGKDPTATENEGRKLTPQERNLVKNQLHAQNKNVHKDLLKRDKPASRQPAKRRTANGFYTGVASGPESATGSADESMDSENDTNMEVSGESVREVADPNEPNYENTHGRKPLTTFMSPQRNARQGFGSSPVSNMEASRKADWVKPPDNLSTSYPDQDRTDSELQVMADVHKTGSQAEIVKVLTPDKQTHSGLGGSLSPDTPRPTLTTFGSPAQAPPEKQTKAIRFKEPDEASDRPTLPPPVAPKPFSLAATTRFTPPVFATMGDIPEDPREDCDSVQSGRSRSLYGSSEIFDTNNLEQTYFNWQDSDIDIPPLDAEDFLSDGGLPSPLTASLGRGRTQDDTSLKGQRSVFFGHDPSPVTGVPKPRPNSSIILRTDHSRPASDSGISSGVSSGVSSDQTSTPVNSEVDPTSPHLPPPPVPQEVTQDGSAFRFPPPPR